MVPRLARMVRRGGRLQADEIFFWNWLLTCVGRFLQFARCGHCTILSLRLEGNKCGGTNGGCRSGVGAFPERMRPPNQVVLLKDQEAIQALAASW